MSEKLETYRKKRDFKRTSEPSGASSNASEERQEKCQEECQEEFAKELRYVMHKHAASHDHFDLRLEYAGVLRSWAVPKGPSLEPGERRLAVEVEDHPLEYGEFEGVIPANEYGGGTVMLWDRGSWEPVGKLKTDRLDFLIHGEKLSGHWTLVRIRDNKNPGRKSGKQWLFIKRSDVDGSSYSETPSADDRSVTSGRTMEQIARGESFQLSGDSEPLNVATVEGGRKGRIPAQLPVKLATLSETPPCKNARSFAPGESASR